LNQEITRWFGKTPDNDQTRHIFEIVKWEKKRAHTLKQRFTEWDWAACVTAVLFGDRNFSRYVRG